MGSLTTSPAQVMKRYLDNDELRVEFLNSLRTHHTIAMACAETGVGSKALSNYRSEHPEFDAEVRAAIEKSIKNVGPNLVQTAISRATHGYLMPVYDRKWTPEDMEGATPSDLMTMATSGKNVVGHKLMPPSDTLLVRLLEAYVPEFKRLKPDVNVSLNMGNENFMDNFIETAYQSIRASGQPVNKDDIRQSLMRLMGNLPDIESDSVS